MGAQHALGGAGSGSFAHLLRELRPGTPDAWGLLRGGTPTPSEGLLGLLGPGAGGSAGGSVGAPVGGSSADVSALMTAWLSSASPALPDPAAAAALAGVPRI
eukprot:160473-Chlamydomonas_euryale.AAC.1